MGPLHRAACAAALLLAALCLLLPAGSYAQPGGKKGPRGGKGGGASETVDQFVAKMMAFDKSKDGKLTKAELIDTRLHELFDRADTKKAGVLTRADLEALFAREKLDGGFGKGPPPFKKKGPPEKQ